MEEIWKNVVGYKGLYQVSNRGRVKSVPRVVTYKNGTIQHRNGMVLSLPVHSCGYNRIILSKNANKVSLYVHRIVALAFIRNPENKSQVNHKNGIKTDNRVENLEWATCSENHYHSFKNGLNKGCTGWRGEKNARSVPVVQYSCNGGLIEEYPSMSDASRATGINPGNIYRSCNKDNAFAGGFKWEYF